MMQSARNPTYPTADELPEKHKKPVSKKKIAIVVIVVIIVVIAVVAGVVYLK